jgi:Xaa-Pro aminopeptidase
MAREELRRACERLSRAGLDAVILGSHANVVTVSGFDEPVYLGSPTDTADGLPLSLAFVDVRAGAGTLLAADSYAEQAAAQNQLGATRPYATFGAFAPSDPAASFRGAVRSILADMGLTESTHARIGIEVESCPSILVELLRGALPNAGLEGCRQVMEAVRAVKTPGEIERLRRTAAAADAGQEALAAEAWRAVGLTELDLWGRVSARVGEAVGAVCPVPLIGELVTGPRTGVVRYPGGPRARRVVAGDTCIMDISVRVDGYWSDCCNTLVLGHEPTAEQRRYFDAARDGFDAALAALRPGARCRDVLAAAGAAIRAHGLPEPAYLGHQIGAAVNEKPRLVPVESAVVEPGMVFCLEPGAYAGPDGTTGARLERMVLVTESGAEPLNRFPWGIA